MDKLEEVVYSRMRRTAQREIYGGQSAKLLAGFPFRGKSQEIPGRKSQILVELTHFSS